MNTLISILILTLGFYAVAQDVKSDGPSMGESITLHLECEQANTSCISLMNSEGKAFLIEKTPALILDPQSISELTPNQGSYGVPSLGVTMVPEKAQAFRELTEKSLGKRLALVFNQKVLTAPVVQSRIDDGRVQITMGASLSKEIFWKDVPWMKERIVTERTAQTWDANRNLWLYALLGIGILAGATWYAFRAPKT